jgi:threonine aldolase
VFLLSIIICSCGGRCLSVEYTDKVGEVAKKYGIKLHIDGARIFNASVVSTY